MYLKNKLPIIFSLIFLTSCNEFQRILKSEDIKLKYEVAEKYYENQEFRRASRYLSKYNRNIGESLKLKELLFFMQIHY